MKERIKKLRKALNEGKGLTQAEFAERIGVKQTIIANYETGRRLPPAAVINNICKEFNASEEWLRTGIGEMFNARTEDEELKASIERILSFKPDSFRQRFFSVLASLDVDGWKVLEDYLRRIVEVKDAANEQIAIDDDLRHIDGNKQQDELHDENRAKRRDETRDEYRARRLAELNAAIDAEFAAEDAATEKETAPLAAG